MPYQWRGAEEELDSRRGPGPVHRVHRVDELKVGRIDDQPGLLERVAGETGGRRLRLQVSGEGVPPSARVRRVRVPQPQQDLAAALQVEVNADDVQHGPGRGVVGQRTRRGRGLFHGGCSAGWRRTRSPSPVLSRSRSRTRHRHATSDHCCCSAQSPVAIRCTRRAMAQSLPLREVGVQASAAGSLQGRRGLAARL